ncbi:MAG: hypothetical protein R3F37_10200 [Candidatus Competibacteraceae bacterium]
MTFALPALGRALSISPAALFRGIDAAGTQTASEWWWLTGIGVASITVLLLLVVPDVLFEPVSWRSVCCC